MGADGPSSPPIKYLRVPVPPNVNGHCHSNGVCEKHRVIDYPGAPNIFIQVGTPVPRSWLTPVSNVRLNGPHLIR